MATTAVHSIGVAGVSQKEVTRQFGVSLPLLIIALVILFSVLFVPRTISDPDLWWHLQDAKLQLASHSFLHHDVYSYTAANARWMNHEWLGEMPYLLGWKLLGGLGVYLVTILTVSIIMLGILFLAWRDSGAPKAAMLAMLPALILASVSFGPRTLLYGWLLLIVELALLQGFRSGKMPANGLYALPALFAVWVNTHGSWMIGLVLFTLFAFAGLFEFQAGGLYAERWSKAQRTTLYKVAAASVAALFCNPYGWRLVVYPFDLAFRQKLNIANVEEWHSVDFHVFRGKVFFATIALLILFRLLRRSSWSLQDALFAFVALYSGLTYMRFMFLAAILITPLLARDMARWMPYHANRDKRLFNLTGLAVVIYLLFSHLPNREMVNKQPDYPVAAVNWLQQHPQQGPIFNEYLWGGYIEFHAPAIKTFIDSRVDIFEYNGTLKDYLDVIHIEDSLAVLDKHHIQSVFIPIHSPLAYLLFHTTGWQPTYKDDVAVLFTRK